MPFQIMTIRKVFKADRAGRIIYMKIVILSPTLQDHTSIPDLLKETLGSLLEDTIFLKRKKSKLK